jgi:flagellar hook protein FlgE
MLQSTGRDTDLAIQGDGFFIYNRDSTQFYSRDGSLTMDAEGYLVNANSGMRIQGWQAVTSGSSATVDGHSDRANPTTPGLLPVTRYDGHKPLGKPAVHHNHRLSGRV